MNDQKHADILNRVERVAALMDDVFHIPGTSIRLGWDSILGWIPGLGDLITVAPQVYLIFQSLRLGVRKRIFARMLLNALIDFLVGVIPGVGDVFDIFFKSNRRNANLLKSELARLSSDHAAS